MQGGRTIQYLSEKKVLRVAHDETSTIFRNKICSTRLQSELLRHDTALLFRFVRIFLLESGKLFLAQNITLAASAQRTLSEICRSGYIFYS